MPRILSRLARFRRTGPTPTPALTPRDLRARLWVSPLEDRVNPAPANDLVENFAAITSTASTTTSSSLITLIQDATENSNSTAVLSTGADPAVNGTNQFNTIWFRFTAATTGAYSVGTFGNSTTSSLDTIVSVGTITGGTYTQLGFSDDFSGSLQSQVGVALTAGTQYYVMVGTYFNDADPSSLGDAQITLVTPAASPPPPPANDLVQNAIAVTPGAPTVTVMAPAVPLIQNATEGGNSTAILTGGTDPVFSGTARFNTVWYTITPTATGTFTISTAGTATPTTLDTVLNVGTIAGGTFTVLAFADDTTGISPRSAVTLTLNAGTTYHVQVGTYYADTNAASQGAMQLAVTYTLPPANDTVGGAIPLTLGIPVNGTLAGANNDYNLTGATITQFVGIGQTVSTAPGRDVVYSFTAPLAGTYVLRLNFGMGANYVMYVAAALAPGTVTSTTGLATNRNTVTTNASEELSGPLAAGQQVFIVVDTNSAADAGGTFRLEAILANPEAASNDTTATAQPLNSNVTGSFPSPDHDFYSLGTPAAGSRVFAMADSAAASSTDLELRVVTDVDTLEWDDDDGDTPFGGVGSVIAGTPLPGVASYLFVRYLNGTTVTPSATSSEPYRFQAVVQPPIASATVESDPGGTGNNTVATATTATNNYFSGTIASAADVDLYGTRAAAGDVLFVALDLNPLRDNTIFDGSLALLDDAGNVLVTVNGGGNTSATGTGTGTLFSQSQISPSEGLWYRVSTAGNYYVRVTGTAAGDYLLSVSRNGTTGGGGLAPTIAGLIAAPQAVNDNATVTPFAAATLTGSTLTARVTYPAANGAFSNAGALGFTGAAGDYAVSGTAAAVQTALRALAFDPADNRVAVGSTESTVFTVSLYAGAVVAPYPAADATNNQTNVVSTSVNDAPGFTGVVAAPQVVLDNATINPFGTVTVAEPDPGQTVTVGVTYSTANGTFTNALALGFTGSAGSYSFAGTPAAAQTALRGLTFAPTPNLLAVGATTDVPFTLSVTDGVVALPTTDGQTTVRVTGANDNPVLGGVTTAPQAVLDTAAVLPFTGVTISDPDPGQSVTVTVTYPAANGTFTTLGGFTGSAGSYTFTGSPAAAQTAIRGLTFVPAQDLVAVGATTTTAFTVAVVDSGPGVSDGQTTVVSTSVNSAPSFVVGADQTVNEDAGPQTVGGWTTGVGGPGAEAGQGLTFQVVGNTNTGLFTSAPAVGPAGTLTFTPAPNANGSATITVRLMDDAGINNGGSDTSATQTFVITVTAVNDAPSFSLPAPALTGVAEDAALQTIGGFATSISRGPADESGQTLAFTVLVTGGSRTFTTAPAIAPDGTLTFQAAPDANGTATLSVTLTDSGAGTDTSPAQAFSITVAPANDAPVNTPLTNSAVAIGATTLLTGLSVTEPIDNVPGATAGYTTTVSVPAGAGTFTGTGFTSGVGTESVTVTGTLDEVNAALATLSYTPVANDPSVTITVVSSDGGNTGGGALADTDSFVLVIKVRPVVTTTAGTTVFTEDGSAAVVDAGLTVTDSDSTDVTRAVVTLTGFVAGEDVLTYTGTLPAGVTADTSVPGTITFSTVSGITPIGDYQALLRTVTYANTSQYPATTPRAVTFTVTDELATSLTSDPAGKAVAVADLNDAPVLSLAVGSPQTFEEQPKALPGVSVVQDVDLGPNPIRVTLSTTAGTLAASGGGVTIGGAGLGTLTVEGPLAAVNAALASLTFTGATDFVGSAIIDVLADDLGSTGAPGPQTATGSFTVVVDPVNDAPSFTPGPNVTVDEDSGATTVPSWATNILKGPADEAGQTVQFLVSNNLPGVFTTQPAIDPAGNLTFAVRANAVGTATVTVRAQDGGGTANGGVNVSADRTFTITLTPVNDTPSFTAGDPISVTEDSGPRTFAGWARAISRGPVDEAGQAVQFLVSSTNVSSSGGPLFSVLPAVDASGTLTFTPAPNANGSATVTVRIQDNGGGAADTSAAQTFTITVVSLNDPPQFLISQPGISAGPGTAPVTLPNFVTNIYAGAPDEVGQTFQFEVTNNGEVLFSQQPAVSPTGTLTFTPAAFRSGVATVTVRLRDSGGDTFGVDVTPPVQTFTITVNGSNSPPSFTLAAGANQTAAEDAGPQTVAGLAANISPGLPTEAGQALTFLVSASLPGLFSTQPAVSPTGTLTYTPAADAVGTATITVRLMDDGGTQFGGVDTSAPQTFTITLTPVNDAPRFTIPSAPVPSDPANGARTLPGFATGIAAGPADEAGQALTFLVSTNNNGLFAVPPAINPATGTLTFTPVAGANGTATVTVQLQDNGAPVGTSAAQTFSIVVAAGAQNSPPTAGPDAITVAANSSPTAVPVLGNDSSLPDTGETLTVTAVGSAAHGLASLSGGAVFYAPAPGYSGSDTFTYTLSDGNGGTATGTVTVTVTAPPVVPPPPPPPPPAATVYDLVSVADQTGSRVRVVNVATGQVTADFLAFPGFTGGVNATVADVTGDGVADVIVGAGPGGGPVVKVFDGKTFREVTSFYAFLPSLRGGVHVSAGDVNGDGRPDVVLGAGAGGGPHVKVVDGTRLGERDRDDLPTALLGSFFAYADDFLGGVSVAAADVDGDGRAEVVTGAGSGGSPHVKVYAGGSLNEILSVIPYAPGFRGGVNVGAGDLDGDGRAEIITGAGGGGSPHVGIYDGRTGASKGQFFAFPTSDTSGVTVAVRPLSAGGATLAAASGAGALKTFTAGKEADLLDGALFGGIAVG